MEMHELIKIETTPALVRVNFEELKLQLAKELEKYDLVITSDAVPEAKKLATELNKTKKMIGDQRKEAVAMASEPIRAFDERMKELEKMCSDGRKKLVDQVARFETETADIAAGLLSDLLGKMYTDHGVSKEFRSANYKDLVKHSAVTPKGNLTKPAREELERRVVECKIIQDRTKSRILALANMSYEAGLSAPLTEGHVEPFLYTDDATYVAECQRIITVELERQAQIEKKAREKAEREDAQDRATAQNKETQTESRDDDIHTETENPVARDDAPDSTSKCVVTCTFSIDVPGHIDDELIISACIKKMEKAGINTLTSVKVGRLS